MKRHGMIIVLSGMIGVLSLSAQEEEKNMLHKVGDGIAWVADSRVANFIAKVGGIACATLLLAKLLRMSSYYYAFGDFYDANDAKYISRIEFGALERRVTHAHGRINILGSLPTNAREYDNLFGR